MNERVYPDSPFICAYCGIDTDGKIMYCNRGICRKCYVKYHLEDVTGYTAEELFDGGKDSDRDRSR